MNYEINDCELSLNKYFKIMENDLKNLSKNKTNNNLRRKITGNVEMIISELANYESYSSGMNEADKKKHEMQYRTFETKFNEFKKQFESLGTTKGTVLPNKNAIESTNVDEITQKINICDMKGCVKRTTSV